MGVKCVNWKPQESFAGLVVAAANLIREKGLEKLKSKGIQLSHGRIGVLSSLMISKKSQAQLCQELGQKAPSMMEMLQRLQKDKLIKKIDHETDKRVKLWFLTKKGEKYILMTQETFKNEGRKLDRFFKKSKISDKQLEELKSFLKNFIELYQ